MILYLRLLLLSLCLVPAQAADPFAKPEDLDMICEESSQDITVNEDASTDSVIHETFRVMREGGRQMLQIRRLGYTEEHRFRKVLEAVTVRPDGTVMSAMNSIFDKEVAMNPYGFDRNRVITVSFPELHLNSKIRIKYSDRIKTPFFEKCYHYSISPGSSIYQKVMNVKIRSKLPLTLQYNDPDKLMEITQGKECDHWLLTCKLVKPACYVPKSSHDNGSMEERYLPWIRVTTVPDTAVLGRHITEGFEAEIVKPLTGVLAQIRDEVQNIKSETDQLNRITDIISEKFNYIQQYRSYKGHFAPRPLEIVTREMAGDCKEMAAMVAAIARKLGYQAHVAVLSVSLPDPSVKYDFITLEDFNHAIVKVTGKDGKVYWLDATTKVSMAQGIFSHLAGRQALILAGADSRMETIPEGKPEENLLNARSQVQTTDTASFRLKGEVTMTGNQAVSFTGSGKYLPADELERQILRQLGYDPTVDGSKVTLPDLSGTTVKDLVLTYDISGHNDRYLKSSAGSAYIMPDHDEAVQCKEVRLDRMTAVYLGTPSMAVTEREFVGADISGAALSDKDIVSPWLRITQRFRKTEKGVCVRQELSVLKPWLTREEIRSSEFKAFQDELKRNTGKIGIIFPEDDAKPWWRRIFRG